MHLLSNSYHFIHTFPIHLPPHTTTRRLQILSRKPQPRPPSRILKNHKLRLEENIAKDAQPDTSTTLEAPKAVTAFRRRGVVEIVTRDDGIVAFNGKGKVGQGGGTIEDVTAFGLVVGGAVDPGVVGVHNAVFEKEEGASGVSDGDDVVGDSAGGADGESAAVEGPEALRIVDGRVGDVACVLRIVNVTEVVAAGRSSLEVGGEERLIEAAFGVGEKGLDLVGFDAVDVAKGEAQESVEFVLYEICADSIGELDGLAGHGDTANINNVSVDVTGGG